MVEHIKTGGAAEATAIGGVVQKLIDTFEDMDLPESLHGLRIVIVADTESEGVCAGSDGYGNDAKDVAASLMQHSSVLLGTVGIGMNVMTVEEMDAMLGASKDTL